ncbi:N-acetylmuramoyl-L-alanine amidase [Fuscibacter oryzae]|uniref:N-acetylmuramoyl-L-alanine amidase n=1 Tax=Fuscibacter oryzae TaxID=2803939 RepID=A0A8J7SU77_9RHOB|nr:N-acetylmuramoyl-L-alanine amidase [Fuscibacter oryzae]MBL4929330.1 N-acetylmuramoyl-L-alanine amidase [Fuscibacter oryzae]
MVGTLTQGAAKYPVTEICLHTSATSATWWQGKSAGQMRDEIRIWHTRDRGWNDIGYHYVIAPDGTVAVGRPLSVVPAQVEGHNRGVIGICMVPIKDVTKISRFEDWYTPAQRDSVERLIRDIRKMAAIKKISGHNEYAAKLCPGFKVVSKDWMP